MKTLLSIYVCDVIYDSFVNLNVVHAENHLAIYKFLQNIIHYSLDRRKSFIPSERHYQVHNMPITAMECCLPLITHLHLYQVGVILHV